MPAALGPVELPVHLLVGDPTTAGPVPLGSVHLALHAELHGDPGADAGTLAARVAPVDPDDLRAQLADLLDAHATALRLPEGSPDAAPCT